MSQDFVRISQTSLTQATFLVQETSENGAADPDLQTVTYSLSELLQLPQITQAESVSHTREEDREIYYTYVVLNVCGLSVAWKRKYTYEGGFASMFGGPVEFSGPFLVMD